MSTDIEQQEPVVLDPGEAIPSIPEDRAKMRLNRLVSSFGVTLATISEMYRDEDWKYLTRDDGSEYSNLADLITDVLPVSSSMARRYVQGARDLHIPLSNLTVEGVVIDITSHDVAELGKDGAADVVSKAEDRLDGVEDPEAAGDIIRDAVDETKKERKRKPEDGSGSTTAAEDADWNDDGSDAEPDLGGGPVSTDPYAGDPDPDPTTKKGSDGGSEADDLIARMTADAPTYDDEQSRNSLPEDMRDAVGAIVFIAQQDPHDFAQMLSYDTRGVLPYLARAMNVLAVMETTATTQPWFLANLPDD